MNSVKECELEYARDLDQRDPLAHFRDKFVNGDQELIYLDGNSLGRLPRNTNERLKQVIEKEWGERLIRSWNENWFAAPERIGGKIAELLGAKQSEVIIADSTSVNLYKLGLAAINKQSTRTKVITDNINFPSDIYILQGIIKLADRDCSLEIIESEDGIHGPQQQIIDAIDEETAFVCLTHTAFKSSYTYDIELITRKAHEMGAMVLWDLSHSVGAVPVDLQKANVDLAVGCTYKYLNGGPGAPAFLYVREDLQEELSNPVSGWMGQKNLFEFGLNYESEKGIRRFLTGTPPILSLCAIEPGLDLIREAGMMRIRQKSVELSEYLIKLWQHYLEPLGFRLNSPLEIDNRGPHISLGHDCAHQIDLALIQEKNVLPDFRAPDNIRLGIPPLYTSFEDVYKAVRAFEQVVREERFVKYKLGSSIVT